MASVTEIFSHHLVTSHAFFCMVSPLTTLLNSLKICCFLLQLVSIWGHLHNNVSLSDMGATFCPCVRLCIRALVLCHSSVAVLVLLAAWITLLLGTCYIWSLFNSMLYLLWYSNRRVCDVNVDVLISHLEVRLSHCFVLCSLGFLLMYVSATKKLSMTLSCTDNSPFFMSDCRRHDLINRATHQHSNISETEGSMTSDVSQWASSGHPVL